MKIAHVELEKVFDTEENTVHTIIIENPSFFYRFHMDLKQIGDNACRRLIISENDMPIDSSKIIEVFDQFAPFDMNRKSLQTKILAAIEKEAHSPDHVDETVQMLGDLERYLYRISFGFDCDLTFPKISVQSLLKATGVEMNDCLGTLPERIIRYMELVREFDRDRLFVTVNMRSYIDDVEMELFMKTILDHGYHLIMVENREHAKIQYEERWIVDKDLCEIG